MFNHRLPKLNDVLSVYAVIATMLFAWSTLLFFWYLPSWMHFMLLGEIAATFSYVVIASFLEGVSFLLFLLVLCFFLPPEYLRDEFAARGTALTLPIIGMIMIYFRITNENIARIIFSVTGLVISLVVILLFYFSANNPRIKSTLAALADRFTVFLYILIPIFVLSLLSIAVRNIF